MSHFTEVMTSSKVLKEIYRAPAITAYNRLEGRPRTVDFTRSLRAEVRDALWFLTRQWQLGEFQGEDAASPIDARVATRLAPFERVSFAGMAAEPYDETTPLEVAVEREAFPWTLPARIEAAEIFLRRVPAGVRAAVATAARIQFPLDPDADWPREPDAHALYRLAASRAFDGAKMLESHTAGMLAADLGAAAADVEPAADAVAAWRQRVFGAAQPAPPRAWIPDRLSYDVRISTAATANGEQALLTAPRYAEGRLDWYAFDAAPAGTTLAPPAGAVLVPEPAIKPLSFVPTAASFPGMPSSRFWEMEDRRINFGSLNAKTTDHLLLIFAEMGLIYGNDWFVIPFEMPVNNLCEVLGLVVTDVFGDRTLVPPANGADENVWQRWSFFSVTGESRDDWRGHFFWLPASLTSVDVSEPLEAVSFARDEMANLAWAVEDIVPDGTGKGIEARLLIPDEPPPPPTIAGVRYTLGTTVPENWVPFMPEHLPGSITDIRLRRGAMPPHGTPPVDPRRRGLLLSELPAPFYVAEEEVPGSGIIVSRRVQRARWYDGRTYLWIGRARETGRGGAASGLGFDQIDDLPPSA
ncbi:hypothetical protein [Mesorhizobium sp. WSM2561]|uniref:hypothetical protein n=1 Tax=Mesorhizobium sp. WSM2561 TaxID=1040985 RepID=UPI0004801DA8|nr:hypothetical protein [Mesorhizobium sp. WSM2561]